MKKIRQIICVLLFCCTVFSLSACGAGLKKDILGSWMPVEDDDGYFTFYSDGTVIATEVGGDSESGTWSILDDDTLEVTLYGNTRTIEVTDISSDSMTWEANGNRMKLVKKD